MAHLCSAHIGNKTFTLPRFGSKRGDQGPKAPQKDEVYGFLPGKGVLKRIGTLPTRLRKNTTKTPPDGDAPTAGTSPLKPHQSMSLARTNISDPAIRKPLEIQIPDGPSASENPQSGAPLKGCVNKTQQCPTPTACQKSPDSVRKEWHAGHPTLYTSLNSSGNSLNDSGIDSGLDSSRRTDCSQHSSAGSSSPETSQRTLWSKAKSEVKRRLENSDEASPANIPMLVIRDYTPPSGWTTKAPVRRGMIVNAQYKAEQWVYVRTSLDTDGFVPYTCVDCMGQPKLARDFARQFPDDGSPAGRPARPYVWSLLDEMRQQTDMSVANHVVHGQTNFNNPGSLCAGNIRTLSHVTGRNLDNVMGSSSQLSMIPLIGSDQSFTDEDNTSLDMSIDSTTTESSIFCKEMGAELTVLFNYEARQENDVSVCKGDIVILLNDEDPEWVWVRTEDGLEGFVPSCYVVDLGKLNLDPRAPTTYL